MNRERLLVEDIQFVKFFIINETDLDDHVIMDMLATNVEVLDFGEPDSVVDRGNIILVSRPSSVVKFIFNVLYTLLARHISDNLQKDKLALGLSIICYEYCHFDHTMSGGGRVIPVIVDSEKISLPTSIIREIIEPIIGKIEMYPVLFASCNFTNTCRSVKSAEHLVSAYQMKKECLPHSKFPLVLCNTSIENQAAENSHLLTSILDVYLGKEKTVKIVKNLLLDADMAAYLILTLKLLSGIPDFVINFLRFLESYVYLTDDEIMEASNIQEKVIAADKFLSQHIKVAAEGNQQAAKQWTQWASILGLIEKQLTPMRGSMWPTSTKIKPFEDKLRRLSVEKARKSNKKELNFEELLESYRDLYDHKAIEPGKIVEHVLKDNRVWQ